MINPNDSAYPEHITKCHDDFSYKSSKDIGEPGLTKQEYLEMQIISSLASFDLSEDEIIVRAEKISNCYFAIGVK